MPLIPNAPLNPSLPLRGRDPAAVPPPGGTLVAAAAAMGGSPPSQPEPEQKQPAVISGEIKAKPAGVLFGKAKAEKADG